MIGFSGGSTSSDITDFTKNYIEDDSFTISGLSNTTPISVTNIEQKKKIP